MMRNGFFALIGSATLLCLATGANAQDGSTWSDETTSSSTTTEEGAANSAEYNRQLLTIEEQVHSLKEDVFRAKATLQLLKEIVVQGSAVGSRATVWHINNLSRSYTIESLAYYLDGQGKFSKVDASGGLNQVKEFKVYEGALPPGNHNLTVNLQLRGNGYGIFSYVQNYTFNVQSSTVFVAEEGKSCSVRVFADERKGFGRSFIERPNVRFETKCIRLADTAAGAEDQPE